MKDSDQPAPAPANAPAPSLPRPDPEVLRANVRRIAEALGFGDCRVARAAEARHAAEFDRWVADGCFGDMAWMAKSPDRRRDPRLAVPGARSVIVLALNYFRGPSPRQIPGRIARYAWGDDYHDLIKERLAELFDYLESVGGRGRYYVDTGPVLERDFASEAGLGWGGKSTVQIHPKLGTWFFLGEIITDLDIAPDAPLPDRCGKCTRCLDACPTQAITAPHRLDARRCLSYLTIEHKGPIPEEFRRALGDRIYGCDDCLDACPWNRFAQISRESAFALRERAASLPLRDFLALTDDGFRDLFQKSPIKRLKRPRFLRNVCIALGNAGTPDDLPALQSAAQSDDHLIAEHARWAIAEINTRFSLQNCEQPCEEPHP